jgi:hypothetical protein
MLSLLLVMPMSARSAHSMKVATQSAARLPCCHVRGASGESVARNTVSALERTGSLGSRVLLDASVASVQRSTFTHGHAHQNYVALTVHMGCMRAERMEG